MKHLNKTIFKVVTLCLMLLVPVNATSQNLITNTFNRQTFSLNGTWNYIIDPYETGYYNYRYELYDQLKKGSTDVITGYVILDNTRLVSAALEKHFSNGIRKKAFYTPGTFYENIDRKYEQE